MGPSARAECDVGIVHDAGVGRRSQPFTQTTWRRVWDDLHQIGLGAITASMSPGHRDFRRSPGVLAALDAFGGAHLIGHAEALLAWVRLMVRPAPWLQEQNASSLPRPRTMKLFAPIEPGMMSWPRWAATAPLRVTRPRARSPRAHVVVVAVHRLHVGHEGFGDDPPGGDDVRASSARGCGGRNPVPSPTAST